MVAPPLRRGLQGPRVLRDAQASNQRVLILNTTDREPVRPTEGTRDSPTTIEGEAPCADPSHGTRPIAAARTNIEENTPWLGCPSKNDLNRAGGFPHDDVRGACHADQTPPLSHSAMWPPLLGVYVMAFYTEIRTVPTMASPLGSCRLGHGPAPTRIPTLRVETMLTAWLACSRSQARSRLRPGLPPPPPHRDASVPGGPASPGDLPRRDAGGRPHGLGRPVVPPPIQTSLGLRFPLSFGHRPCGCSPAPTPHLTTSPPSRRFGPLQGHRPPPYHGSMTVRAFGVPSMGQAVKTHLRYTPSDLVSTASVRFLRRPGWLLAE